MMKKTLLVLTCLVVGLQAAPVSAQRDRIAEGRHEALELGWMSSYKEGRQHARKTNRPMMVVFRCVP